MKIYTQRLEDISPDQAFETVELTFDTRQKSRFRAAL
ncbi:urease accessory protein UreE, partial [Acinetobacter baumannii]